MRIFIAGTEDENRLSEDTFEKIFLSDEDENTLVRIRSKAKIFK